VLTLLNNLILLSSDFLERIEQCDLDDFEAYMGERDQLFADLQKLQPDRTQAATYRPLIDLITQQDAVIVGRMTAMRNEASEEIENLSRGKRSKVVYDSGPYSEDSRFFDRKR